MSSQIKEQILSIVRKPGYQPLNKSELARDLGIPPKDRAFFRRVLAELVSDGKLVQGKKARYRLPGKQGGGVRFVGTIQFSGERKRKSAFFVPENPDDHRVFREMDRPRIFVPARSTSVALDGDKVEVEIGQSGPPKWHKHSRRHRERSNSGEDRWTARVVNILERNRSQFVGKYFGKGARATLRPDDGRLPPSIRLTEVMPEAKLGDIVVAELVGWDDPFSPPLARMTKVLGREDDPGVDMLAVIHKYGLPLEFPDAVLREAELIDEVIDQEEIDRREDWREKQVFTIDPEDAKDFDDAICVTEKEGGGWELAVHIADVSHYVKSGSALDKEAQKRGNSVYLADRVIPMLPEKLSNGVCSLKPNVERLTHAAIMQFDEKGKMTSSRFASAVIRSHHRFSYEEAFELMQYDEHQIAAIEDEKMRSLAVHLARAWDLGGLLRRRRFANGALDLDFPEVRVVLDEKGRAVGVKRSEYDESHQLIEEFMLAANEAVAYETKNAPAPSIYRIHEDPDPSKLEEFADLARTFGHQVGDVTYRPELQKLLKAIRGTLEEHSVKIALLKSLRRAAYSCDPLGHYGLSKTNYTHFTSPIRRYADLIVHRVLRRILSRRHEPTAPEHPDKTPPQQGMSDIAQHISKTERVAADAEMETQRMKMIEYLERLCSEDDDTVFDATVFEMRPIGAFIELDELYVKGMIRKDDLPPTDEYFFDRVRDEFRSRTMAPTIGVGKQIKVRLYRVNRDRGFVDFVPA